LVFLVSCPGDPRDLHSFLHDALPIFAPPSRPAKQRPPRSARKLAAGVRPHLKTRRGSFQAKLRKKADAPIGLTLQGVVGSESCIDRKSTRLNSSHVKISYAVFCLKKK